MPQLVVQVCRNGMTITRYAVRAVHLGERLDESDLSVTGVLMVLCAIGTRRVRLPDAGDCDRPGPSDYAARTLR